MKSSDPKPTPKSKKPRQVKTSAKSSVEKLAEAVQVLAPQKPSVKANKPSSEEASVPGELVVRAGKDEMNLVEYPFATLWKGSETESVISHEWETRHPINGRTLQASWRVTGDPERGLPNASDERVYLVLMELTRAMSFETQTISFSRYDILRRLGWDNNARAYEMLARAFERLMSVTITARNAFWDPHIKSFRNVGFTILDHYNIVAEKPGRKAEAQRELPVSYFKWSDVMFASFQAGFLKTLDLDFALALESPLALRLYRYLDKKAFGGRATFEIDLISLCERHLGMRSNPYLSKYKERLAPAHHELLERGFLRDVTFVPMKTKKSEKVCYHFNATTPIASEPTETLQSAADLVADTLASTSDPEIEPEMEKSLQVIEAAMLDLGLAPETVRELLAKHQSETLRLQLECLEDRNPRDRAALFLYALRCELPPPPTYWERLQREQNRNAAQNQPALGETAPASEQNISAPTPTESQLRQARESSQRMSGETCTFFEALSDKAKAEVRQRVRGELKLAGFQARLMYPHPAWVQVLAEQLRDEEWKLRLQNLDDDSNYDEDKESAPKRPPEALKARLELYVEAVTEILAQKQTDFAQIDNLKEQFFPLLSNADWQEIKRQIETQNNKKSGTEIIK